MLIGRTDEKKRLNELYDSGKAELVALYGRRRVGKTHLIDEVFEGKICFNHAGLSPVEGQVNMEGKKNNHMKEQLNHFYRSLVVHGYKGKKAPKSWLEAFYVLEDLLMQKYSDTERILVFLDEIQWLDTPKAKFITGLEAFWNGWACHKKNVMVIVCGSSSSWILDNLINNHGGLYGRVTYEMKLHPFSLRECEEYFHAAGIHMSRYDVVQSYMAFGGIPYYLRYFNREYSLPQNIDSLLFSKEAPLQDEFDRLFSSLFVNPEVMKLIIKTIGSRNRGLTREELINETGIADGGELSKQLKSLMSGDFIIEYSSFGSSKRKKYYKLTDPFCLFFLNFFSDKRKGRRMNWVNMDASQTVVSWKGLAFENVCWNHINQIKKALGIYGVSSLESLWSKRGDEKERGAQIDLIIERKDNVVNMCEIKFYSDEFKVDKEYHLVLEERKKKLREIIPRKSVVHSTLITTFGLKKSDYFGDFVHVLTLDQLFQ